MDRPQRRLCFAADGIPPVGRLLVATGRILLVETTTAEVAALREVDPVAAQRCWAPGEDAPELPPLTEAEQLAVSAAATPTPEGRARHLDGASWDDPRATPPDPVR